MPVRSRKVLVFALVGVFAGQTYLVYSDPAGRRTPALSDLAARGKRIWLEHNCQSCHQIYGFGGFLGPDLTNLAPSLTEARLEKILTEGSGQMPAFHLGEDDRRAIAKFLEEVDRTGVSQPRLRKRKPPEELLEGVLQAVAKTEGPLPEPAARGRDFLFKEKCLGCHLPNQRSTLKAPDLSGALERLGHERILQVFRDGVPGKSMPRFDLTAAKQEEILAFLAWLQAHRDAVLAAFAVTAPGGENWWKQLPWFEYGR